MKKIIYLFSVTLFLIVTATSCYDRDVIDSKEGISLPGVSNLSFTRNTDSTFTLTWSIPDNIPEEFNRPVSAYIQVYKRRDTNKDYTRLIGAEVSGEPTSYTTPEKPPGDDKWEQYRAGDDVRVVVKLKGNFKEVDKNKSNEVFSLGQILVVD